MIHAKLSDGHTTYEERDFNSIEELDQANLALTPGDRSIAGADWDLLSWDSDQISWCEYCNHGYELKDGVTGEFKTGRRGFCSPDCKTEAEEETKMWAQEARYDALTGENGPPDSDPNDHEPPQF